MATEITIVEGDTAGPLRIVLSDADGPKGLAGASVEAHFNDPATGHRFSEACTIVDESAAEGETDRGAVEISGSARAAWMSGAYDIEVVVTWGDSSIDIWPSSHEAVVTVRPRRTA